MSLTGSIFRCRRRRTLLLPGLALVAILAACGGGSSRQTPQAPMQSLPLTQDSPSFTYHYSTGDSIEAQRQEAWYAWAVGQLGVRLPQKAQYYKYTSTAQMQQITGRGANAWADVTSSSIHTIFSWDNHEITHLLTASIGRPSDFFNEGIAVSMQCDPYGADPTLALWSNQPLDTFPRTALAQGRLPHVQQIADTQTFRAIPDTDGYPWAGSFIQFLVKQYGMTKTLDFFRGGGGRDESLSTILARFQQVYGISLSDADLAWRAYLSE